MPNQHFQRFDFFSYRKALLKQKTRLKIHAYYIEIFFQNRICLQTICKPSFKRGISILKKMASSGLLIQSDCSCRGYCHWPFPKQQILDSSKLKDFADDNFKFDENGRKFSKMV